MQSYKENAVSIVISLSKISERLNYRVYSIIKRAHLKNVILANIYMTTVIIKQTVRKVLFPRCLIQHFLLLPKKKKTCKSTTWKKHNTKQYNLKGAKPCFHPEFPLLARQIEQDRLTNYLKSLVSNSHVT